MIGATYECGAYGKAEERFIESGLETANWTLAGDKGSLVVLFEKYEGYYFAKFSADKAIFLAGCKLLKREYLLQGGDPNKHSKDV